MLELSYADEKEIVYELYRDDNFLGAGASRLCYEGNSAISKLLREKGLNLEDDDYIIKVAIGVGGVNQNRVEADNFKSHSNMKCFADIYAAGKIITIMKKLYFCERFRDSDLHKVIIRKEISFFCGSLYPKDRWAITTKAFLNKLGLPCDLSSVRKVMRNVLSIGETIDEINCQSCDSLQVGLAKDGTVLSYDYGYISDYEDAMTSDASDYISYNREEYMEAIIDLLDRADYLSDKEINSDIGIIESNFYNDSYDYDDYEYSEYNYDTCSE